MSEANQRLHAIVTGHVQGVSFRYYTAHHARELGIVGWVRNLPDGTVEVMAEGPPKRLSALLQFLHQGPPAAHVYNVKILWQAASDQFDDFHITS